MTKGKWSKKHFIHAVIPLVEHYQNSYENYRYVMEQTIYNSLNHYDSHRQSGSHLTSIGISLFCSDVSPLFHAIKEYSWNRKKSTINY